MAYNSDGYIMIDFTEVDFRRTNQTIEGLFKRCVDVIGTNKFILVINANGRTPLPATCSFTNNQYVIDTVIYMFAVSSNDNLFIRRNDVPASDIIDDSSMSVDKTWSSNKIDTELDTKADASALADYQPLLTAGTNITIDENNVISSTGGAVIDDTVIVNNKVWSSLNTVEMLAPIDTVIGNPATLKSSLILPFVEFNATFNSNVEGVSEINISQFGNIANISHDNESRLINPQYFTLTYSEHNTVTFTPTLAGSLIVVWNLIYVTSDMVGKTLYLNMSSNNANYSLYRSDSIDYDNMQRASNFNITSYTLSNADLNKYIGLVLGNSSGNPCSLSNVMISFADAKYQDYYTPITYNIPFNNTYYDGGVVDIVNKTLTPAGATPISITVPDISIRNGINTFDVDYDMLKISYKHLPIDLL